MLLRILKRLVIPVGVFIVGSSWVSLGLFLFLSIRWRMHGGGWPGPATEHQLLFLVMALAVFHSVVMVLVGVGLRKHPGRRNAEETRWWVGIDLGNAVVYALIAGWCWTAWRQSPLAFLSGAATVGLIILVFAPTIRFLWGLRRLRRTIASRRRA